MNEPAVRTFACQKSGNTEQEYEDALAYDVPLWRFAIADGTSESAFAKLWADILVREFVRRAPGVRLREWLISAREQWCGDIPWADLPWYAEEKTKMGSHSTFAGLWLSEKSGNRWHALAIGDSCVFQVRKHRMAKAFPLNSSDEFDKRPGIVSSIPSKRARRGRMWRRMSGDWCAEDAFVLATDAVAQWCLRAVERGVEPWPILLSVASNDDFRLLVEELRLRGEMRNDDSSLVIVEVPIALADTR